MSADKRRRQAREVPEAFDPFELNRRIPVPVLWIAIALAIWGALLLFDNPQPFNPRVNAPTPSPAQAADNATGVATAGAQAFVAHCSTCHQPNASGVRLAVPPLAGSPFVAAAPEVMTQILLHGIDGPIRVGGNDYDGHMPDFSSVLADGELALIVNHVRQTWGGASDRIDAAFVATQRKRFGVRGSWQGGEELARVLAPQLAPQPPLQPRRNAKTDPAILRLVSEGRGDVWSCASCHGNRGQGAMNIPRLAGLPADYIAKQLRNYTDGSRRNESMEVVARGLHPDEVQGLAQYYAGLRAPSTARPSLHGDLARGEHLALHGDWNRNIPACFSCHGPSGFGVEPNFPALAAQQPEYTVAQLVAWVNRSRDNSDIQLMDHIAQALDDSDRRSIADYLATLPPVPALPDTEGAVDAQAHSTTADQTAGETHVQQ